MAVIELSPQAQVTLLRDALDKAWMDLGRYVLECGPGQAIARSAVETVCDEIAETMNLTDPELRHLSPRMRATYSHYQPIEVLHFIQKSVPKLIKRMEQYVEDGRLPGKDQQDSRQHDDAVETQAADGQPDKHGASG